MTFLNRDVGKMSRRQEEDFILSIRLVRHGSILSRIVCQEEHKLGQESEEKVFDLMSLNLPSKKERNLLHSLGEKNGTAGDAGVTLLLMVSTKTFSFSFLYHSIQRKILLNEDSGCEVGWISTGIPLFEFVKRMH